MRLFIAFDPEDAIKERIAKEVKKLSAKVQGIKWVEEQNLHVTLKFLGEVGESELDKVFRLAEDAAAGREGFKVRFQGMGKFPHVIWIGIKEGEKELREIAEKLGSDEFSAHLTIGRIKEKRGAIDLVKYKEFDFGEMPADRIKVIKSKLTPKGPIYEVIKEVNLCRMKS